MDARGELLMLRGADVPRVMTWVELALNRHGRRAGDEPGGVLFVDGDLYSELGTSRLRATADLAIEFHSGSARPVIGPTIRLAKRAVRRGLRWYIEPITTQQSRFNHEMLDVLERLGVQIEKLLDSQIGALRCEPEDDHLGSIDDVREQLRAYLPPLRSCRKVLDLSCGRGELLTVLGGEGVAAYGVHADEGAAEAARRQGLTVVVEDPVAHLRGLEPGDVDGVVCRGLAEHLDTESLLSLLDLCVRKLEPGGVMVVETLDPATLPATAPVTTGPGPVRARHPDALRCAMEAVGFESVRIEPVQPVDVSRCSGTADLSGPARWAEVAGAIDRLNARLAGPKSFIAVASTPRRP